ncbi:MAG: YihY family inner membrane protein [Epsilonproteobacteria bacterium]|nr:YihY family inner membrane protein [Campylobacterota bacterium]
MNSEKESLKTSLKNYFIDHNLLHYASSLSFHTVLALIPVLLLSLYLFTKLTIFEDYYGMLKEFIFSTLLPIHHESVSQNIDQFMSNTSSLGVIGIVFVLYVSLMFFDDFEYVINKIFQKKPRDFFHSIAIYLVLTIVIPLGLLASIYLSIKANILIQDYGYSNWIDMISITSYLILWVLFFVVYYISPNAKIFFKSALFSSLIASAIWYSSKMLFVYYVAYNKTYTTIYGSFSTIMFFFLWIYVSWIIVLFGAKLCYYLNEHKKQKRSTQEEIEQATLKDRT